jgi:hypothetical protein
MTAVGERVGAILSGNDQEVQFLGYGEYLGNLLRPTWKQDAEFLLPAQRAAHRQFANQTVEEWLDWHSRQNDWTRDHTPEHARPDEALPALAQRSYDDSQQKLEWTDEQVLEDLKTSRILTNPCIRLDSGDIVWGMECWWGPEEKVREQLERWQRAGARIVEATLPADRFTTP